MSHSTQDRPWVEWLAKHAASIGVVVYLAEHDVQPGTVLADKVQRNIATSDAIIPLISSRSVSAPYVQQEVGYALGLKKLVIPLVQPGVEVNQLAMLQGLEYIAFDFGSPEDGLQRLLVSLQKAADRKAAELRTADQERLQFQLALAVLGVLIVLALTAKTE